jgi:hypothetical protein
MPAVGHGLGVDRATDAINVGFGEVIDKVDSACGQSEFRRGRLDFLRRLLKVLGNLPDAYDGKRWANWCWRRCDGFGWHVFLGC